MCTKHLIDIGYCSVWTRDVMCSELLSACKQTSPGKCYAVSVGNSWRWRRCTPIFTRLMIAIGGCGLKPSCPCWLVQSSSPSSQTSCRDTSTGGLTGSSQKILPGRLSGQFLRWVPSSSLLCSSLLMTLLREASLSLLWIEPNDVLCKLLYVIKTTSSENHLQETSGEKTGAQECLVDPAWWTTGILLRGPGMTFTGDKLFSTLTPSEAMCLLLLTAIVSLLALSFSVLLISESREASATPSNTTTRPPLTDWQPPSSSLTPPPTQCSLERMEEKLRGVLAQLEVTGGSVRVALSAFQALNPSTQLCLSLPVDACLCEVQKSKELIATAIHHVQLRLGSMELDSTSGNPVPRPLEFSAPRRSSLKKPYSAARSSSAQVSFARSNNQRAASIAHIPLSSSSLASRHHVSLSSPTLSPALPSRMSVFSPIPKASNSSLEVATYHHSYEDILEYHTDSSTKLTSHEFLNYGPELKMKVDTSVPPNNSDTYSGDDEANFS